LPLPSSNTTVQNIIENYIPTAIATLIEPMWILINRLLCVLQPLQELQDCNAEAKKSIDLNYSSLPPQLVILKALKSKHFVLAAVCTMALFANVLAVAFAGLFNQDTFDVRHTATFQPPYQLRFVPINGSLGPIRGSTIGTLEASGAYQGGSGDDQFLIAESNFTGYTPLPAWTDDTLFYQPFFDESTNTTQATKGGFEAETKAFGAELDCMQLHHGNNFQTQFNAFPGQMSVTVNVTVPNDAWSVRCSNLFDSLRPGPMVGSELLVGLVEPCASGPSSLELIGNLQPRVNATQREVDVCEGTAIFAWIRDQQGACSLNKRNITLSNSNSLFVQCRPRLVTGSAKILVDASGRLQHAASNKVLDSSIPNNTFSTDPFNIIAQSNRYLIRTDGPSGWHNDSFADDYMNYFIIRLSNSTRAINPNTPVPTFDDVAGPLKKTYSKLFAIWLGGNKKSLFIPQANEDTTRIQGVRILPEQRLFLSTTMFILSEVILCTYVIVAIWVYIRRPGEYLARLPTSIAAVIALFAASSAVLDMQDTSHLDKKGRARHLKQVDARYVYGSYIGGGDGRLHVGIEKRPFVRTRAKTTWLEQKLPILRKGSQGIVSLT
jgi:hypothetical protein